MPQKTNQADHQLNSAVGQKKTKKNSWVTESDRTDWITTNLNKAPSRKYFKFGFIFRRIKVLQSKIYRKLRPEKNEKV